MYRLFDEGDISLDGCSSAVDCFEAAAVKGGHDKQQQQQQQQQQQGLIPAGMVAQESQAQAGYGELLQQGNGAGRDEGPRETIALEELRLRTSAAVSSSTWSPAAAATAASNHVFHHHHHHHHSRHHQSYYNMATVQESPCSTVYFGELEAAAGPGSQLAAGGGARGPDSSSSSAEAATAEGPLAVPGLAVASKPAPASTASSTSSNPSAIEPYQSHRQRHHQQHRHHHHHQQQQQQHMATTPPAMITKQSRGDAGAGQQGRSGERSSKDDGHHSKKRKVFCNDGSEVMDDQGDDSKSVRSNDDSKKQNHSEIEKRRRDKMNTYITELSAMVPMCHAMSRKLDKLTVLRMAVQHLKTILGAATSYTEGHYKPAFLSEQELKTLILQVSTNAAEGFVFVVGCDRGRILYVSKSVSETLNYSQGDLMGQSWFDILHPKDVAKVKEQLSSSDLSPRERLIDAKTMLPVKTDVPQGVSRLCPGARRSFFCRMKRKVDARCGEAQIKEEADTTTGCHRRKKQQNHDWKYCVIQCTGYLKSWAPAKIGLEEQESEADGEACNLSCLVAVGRIQVPLVSPSSSNHRLRLRNIEFVSRHAMDGKFLFVDQRATLVLGFLPQELLGTSMYEYYHHDDIPHLAESHKAALQSFERVTTQVYRFRSKAASFIRLCSEWKSFKNPWTKDIEYLIAKNSAVFSDTRQVESSANRSEGGSVQENYDYFAQSNGGLERLISSHVEVSKIGRQIAEEVLDLQRRSDQDSSSGSSPTPGPEPALLNAESQITTTASPEQASDVRQAGSDNSSSNPATSYNHINNNVQLNIIASDQGPPVEEDMMEMIGGTTINESPNPVPTDGNDEAAMAVIMSLLEADAGLGGPVDFSGLPWPLP